MVATVFELRSSAVSVSYYERDGYYAKNDPEHRQASFWHGGAAKAQGLRAHVRPSLFEEVLSGWVPGTDIRLGRMREGEHEHRPGWDITFSAPKSVSLEALAIGDRRVIRAHDEAVRATLDWVEAELLETRGWDPAARRRPRVKAEGMVVAGFRHLTSRDQDPQLHTHCVLANMTRNASGEWRSVEPTRIRRSQKLIGAYYRNELARRLQSLGMAVTPRMVGPVPGFELAGYERSFLDAFSGRRRAILEHLERLGLPYTPELAQMAALHTRRRKRDRGLAELVPEWRAKARALGLSREKTALAPPRPIDPLTGERVSVPRVPPPDLPANAIRSMKRAPALPRLPRDESKGLSRVNWERLRSPTPAELSREPELGVLEAVSRAVSHASERRTVLPEAEIRAVALGHAPGRYTLAGIDAAIGRLVGGGELIEVERRGMDRAFVTDRAVKAERRVLAAMRAGRGKGMALANGETVEKRLDGTRLTRGQKEAVRAVLLSDDLVIGVQGDAGSGKTTMLHEVSELLGERRIHGLAPSAVAARVLQRGTGIPSRTLQYFLTRLGDLLDEEGLARARKEYAGSVLAVDEASMIDTVRMEDLLRIAARLGVARVALVGDTEQLRPVDAGQPFRLLQKAGMATATMDEVVRQRDRELLRAVKLTREGEPGAAIEGLGERVREAPREELGHEAAMYWLALPPEERDDTLLLAPTHTIRRQTNEAVRVGLEREGTLHGRTLEIDRLVDRRLTRAQASDIGSYEPGDIAVFHRDHYGCRRDDICTVIGIEGGRVVLAHPDGEERRFQPSGNAAWYLRICDTERIELRAGDRIRWTRNRKVPPRSFAQTGAPDLVNGGEAEIVEIDYSRVRFRDGEGFEFNLALTDPQLRHLDHAYCSTVHAAQGRTARAAIAVLDAGSAADRQLFHVELSRVSDKFLLLTDDREALIELLEARPAMEDGALEALGVDPAEIPAVDLEVFAALAEDWKALRQQAEETETIPFFLPGYGGVMARAAALSTIEDLPVDMRRLTDTMLAEHEEHLARDREVRNLTERIQENWRRWPELGWAAQARGCAVEELPQYDAWREEGTALLEAGRTLLEADDHAGRHLHAMPGGRAGLEGAVETLERTRLRDEALLGFEARLQEVNVRALAADTIPYYAKGHDALLESARALAGMADLPAHAREAAGEIISEAEANALRVEAAGLLEERGEMETAFREDPGNRLVPTTESPDYAAWSARCETAEGRWQAMRDEADTWDPHLDRLAGGKAALEADLDRLGDLRGHDEAWAELYAIRSDIVERMRAERTAAFDLPEWDDFAGMARALEARSGLPEAAARAAKAVLDYDRRCREVDAFLPDAEAHGARWDALRAEAARGENVSIIDLPGYAPLTEAERALHATGEAIQADGAGPHLDRVRDGAARATAAQERLESHALLDRCVAAMNGLGAAAGSAWASLPGDPPHKALEDAEELAKKRALEEEARRRLEAAIEEQAALLARLAAIRQLLRDMEALDRLEQEFGKSAAKYEELPRSLVPGWEDWRAANEAFLEAARPPLEDAAFEDFRQARPDLADGIREAVGTVRDRLALTAPEVDLDTVLDGTGYREQESAWQSEAADFRIACDRDIVAGDLVYFTAPADALPGSGDSEEREVSVVAGLIERTAGRTEPEDLCTLETLRRSDGGPGGPFTVRLDLLTVGDCARMGWDKELARIGPVGEQAWEHKEERQKLFEEAVRRERHLSMKLRM